MSMSVAALRAKLQALLSDLLGNYTTPAGAVMQPAIYAGEPPSDWLVTGLEIRIEPNPEFGFAAVHHGVGTWNVHLVRVIPHATASAPAAVQRIVEAFDTQQPIHVPGSEELGLLSSYTIRINSERG